MKIFGKNTIFTEHPVYEDVGEEGDVFNSLHEIEAFKKVAKRELEERFVKPKVEVDINLDLI